MPVTTPSLSRFRSSYSRQTALWILRAYTPGLGRREFFSANGYAEDDVARFLGLPEKVSEGTRSSRNAEMDALHCNLETTSLPVGIPARARGNLDAFAATLRLNAVERIVLEFFVCLKLDPILAEAWFHLENQVKREPGRYLGKVLGVPRAEVEKALDSSGRLLRCRLLGAKTRYGDQLCLEFTSDRVAAQLFRERYNTRRILDEFHIVTPGAPDLGLGNFPHLREPLSLLLAHLAKTIKDRRRGVNILLHGVPGTGKTQLTRVLAAALALPIYEISTQKENGEMDSPESRLGGLDFADAFLANHPSLFVFDEAEDVFGATLLKRSAVSTHKGWFNAMLERNRWPVFWLSNEIRGLDAAFARRFDLILEVPVPPLKERLRVVNAMVGDLVGAEFAERIATAKTIAPAVLARAGNVLRSAADEMPPQTCATLLGRVLGDTLKAQGHPDPFRCNPILAACGSYDLSFLNTPSDLVAISRQLRSLEGARLCLHGPPGTGKTAFGHWLAAELDRPLHAKKASDLLGRYVGETEERLSEAFDEATRDGAILLLDEVDSFLAKREEAQRQWEITCVNEMLTQIESFSGLLVASTNRLDALDPASLRRFDLKIAFDYLRGDQAVSLFVAQCRYLGLAKPVRSTCQAAARLATCTPGDFAAVARRHRFAPFDSADGLLAAVCGEILHRTPAQHAIGFA